MTENYKDRKVFREWGDFSVPDEGTILSEPDEDGNVTIEWTAHDVPYPWSRVIHIDDIHYDGWKPDDHWFGNPKGIFFSKTT